VVWLRTAPFLALNPKDRRQDYEVMSVTVADICALMEDWAPLSLAEQWDNPGLQVGDPARPVSKVWVALDPLGEILRSAAENRADLIITHHPLIFQPLRRIDLATALGNDIRLALEAGIAVYCAHTNLDSAAGGVNDVLAEQLGLTCTGVLDSQPGTGLGIGRVGYFETPVALAELASRIKQDFRIKGLKYAGDSKLKVERAAICSGSGSGLMKNFLAGDAQVYISGDLHYHDARQAEQCGRGVIDMGHFASERIVVRAVAGRLRSWARESGVQLEVVVPELETDPFVYL